MLVDRKYDVIFLFGIIHHLLRQGIQRNLLTTFEELFAKISSISQVGIIVEFAEPTEASLNLPEVSPFREEFKIDKFLKALKRHYSQVNLLGKCKYRPNRLMYYALR